MFSLALRNLLRRPVRTILALAGLAVPVAVLSCLLSFSEGYKSSLHTEIDRMGMQMMLVPLGCPYDAAARVLKGRSLDVTLPESALQAARKDPAVEIAAPTYTAVLPRPKEGRTDLWVGIDDTTRPLKPWWKLKPGSSWFTGPDSAILGAEAAAAELRKPGDKFYSPETGRTFTVCGVLERSGTSDDSLFFVPLATAQTMFKQPGRLTAISIRLKDPAMLSDAADRLQQIKGAQTVTLTEMMGTFLNLVGAARTLVLAISLVAVAISALSVFNTMMGAVIERTRELGIMRAIGISRGGAFGLMLLESLWLATAGGLLGFGLALLGGPFLERAVHGYVPLAPEAGLPTLTAGAFVTCITVVLGLGVLAGLYPAWQASRLRPSDALRLE